MSTTPPPNPKPPRKARPLKPSLLPERLDTRWIRIGEHLVCGPHLVALTALDDGLLLLFSGGASRAIACTNRKEALQLREAIHGIAAAQGVGR